MKIETKNGTITLNGIDEENIIEGLATLIDVYADDLKKRVRQIEISRNVLECEIFSIDECIKKIKSANDTLTYFCESEISEYF